MVKIIEELKKKKYHTRIIYIFLDNPLVSIERIKIRVAQGGHSVPDEDVVRRFHRSKMKFWNIYRNLVDEWQLLYNGEEGLILVATGERETYRVLNDRKFRIFKKGC